MAKDNRPILSLGTIASALERSQPVICNALISVRTALTLLKTTPGIPDNVQRIHDMMRKNIKEAEPYLITPDE